MNFSRILQEEKQNGVEFTESMDENAFCTISAFSNTNGGTMFCGVKSENNIPGFDCNDKNIQPLTTKIIDKMGINPTITCFNW